jgi:hypothetical protein
MEGWEGFATAAVIIVFFLVAFALIVKSFR